MQPLESRTLLASGGGALDPAFGGGKPIIIEHTRYESRTLDGSVTLPDGTIVTVGVGTRRPVPGEGIGERLFTTYSPSGKLGYDSAEPDYSGDHTEDTLATSDGAVLTLKRDGLKSLVFSSSYDHNVPFGGDGKIDIDFLAKDLSVDAQGRIYVSGRGVDGHGIVERYDSNGMADFSFGTRSRFTTTQPIGQRESWEIDDVATDAAGRVYLAVNNTEWNERGKYTRGEHFLARLSENGALETRFGVNGFESVDDNLLSETTRHFLSIDSSGVGYYVIATSPRATVYRIRGDRPRDPVDSSGGVEVSTLRGGFSSVGSVARQSDGRLLLGGWIGSPTKVERAVMRLNTDLTPDRKFDRDGIATTGVGGSGRTFVSLPADGTIVVVGSAGESFDPKTMIARLLREDAPLASLETKRMSAASTGTRLLRVTYRDGNGIDTSTLGRGDLRVTGPGGFVQYAKFSGFTSEQAGRVIHAVYKLVAPLVEGSYSVRLIEGQVFDVNGLANDRQTVGAFTVETFGG
jgi:hypothetical protein